MTNAEIANAFIAEGWEDVTGGNDACDYILRKDDMQLVICAEDRCDREDEEWARFQLTPLNEDGEPNYDEADEFEDLRYVRGWYERYKSFQMQAARQREEEARLCAEWERECEARGLPHISADEVIYELDQTDPNYAYVTDFIFRWETMEAMA